MPVPLSPSVLHPVSLVHRAMLLPPVAVGLCATLMIFGMTVEDVLCNTEWSNSLRNLECVEIFAGVGSVAAAALELKLRAATYDKNRIPGSTEATEDITTQQGFRTAVSLVMRLVPAGLLWLAPDCSSWGYMNASQCKRKASNGYEGDPLYTKVVAGNAMVKATVFLMLLAACRDVRAAMENPLHSTMFRYPLVGQVETALAMTSAIAYRCAYSSEPFGKRYLKGYRFLAIGKWIRGVAARCQCPDGAHTPLVTKKIGSDGKVKHSGIAKRLKESGAYPLALGRRIVACATPGQPLQPSDCPDNDTALSSSVQHPVSSTKATRVRKTVLKKPARAAVQRPVSSSVQHPVPNVSAPSWLQPVASATITTGDNDTALSSSVQHPVSSTKATRVRKTVLKKPARAAVQRPVSSSVQHPVPNVSAPSWLQPVASATITTGRSKRGPVVHQAAWCTPVATSTAGRGSHQRTPAVASTPGQSSSASWLTPSAER